MALTIATPAEGQAAETANVHLLAMEADALTNSQFPTPDSKEHLRTWLEKNTLDHLRDSDKGVLMAVDKETGEVASTIKWVVYRKATGAHGEAAEVVEDHWPAPCREAFINSYADLTADFRKRVLGDGPYYHITYLCTKPTCGGRGAASSLLRRVQELATADGLDVILEATMTAVGLYKKLGFEVKENIETLMPSAESSEPTVFYEERCMVWSSSSAAAAAAVAASK